MTESSPVWEILLLCNVEQQEEVGLLLLKIFVLKNGYVSCKLSEAF